jgi:hypothetical protein
MLSNSLRVERFDNPSRTPELTACLFLVFSVIEVDYEVYMSDWPTTPTPSGGWRLPKLRRCDDATTPAPQRLPLLTGESTMFTKTDLAVSLLVAVMGLVSGQQIPGTG